MASEFKLSVLLFLCTECSNLSKSQSFNSFFGRKTVLSTIYMRWSEELVLLGPKNAVFFGKQKQKFFTIIWKVKYYNFKKD